MDSARTQRELEQLRQKATALRKDQVVGSQEFARAAKVEVDIKNKLHTLNVQAYSDNARIRQSYFDLGQELRAHKTHVLNLAGALGADRTGLGGVLLALAGPGGWIALTTAALAGIILQLRETRDAAKQAAEQGFDRLAKSQLAATDRSSGDLQARARAARSQLSGMMKGYRGEFAYETAMLLPSGVPGAVPKEDQIRYDFLKKIVGEAEAELAIRQAILVAKQNEIVLDEILITGQVAKTGGASSRPATIANPAIGQGLYNQFYSPVGLAGGGSLPGLSPIDNRPGSEVVPGVIGAAESLKEDLDPVWGSMALSITSILGGAFAAVFTGAEISAKSLFASLFGALVSYGVSYGLNQLFPALGGNILTAGASSPSHTGITTARRRDDSGGGGKWVAAGRELRLVLDNESKFRRRFAY